MVMRLSVLCACLLLPRTALAETVVSFAAGPVTWEAVGVIEQSSKPGFAPPLPRPSVGTPFVLSLTFNPSAAVPTLANQPDCVKVAVSGSLQLGGVSYTTGGLAFTHAQLPGSSCVPSSPYTQFSLHEGFTPTGDDPWNLGTGGPVFGLAYYVDLLVQDAFPEIPITTQGLFNLRHGFPDSFWSVTGSFTLQAVGIEQPAAVPEPGTLTLFGPGLAAAARRFRTRRS